MLDPTDRKIVNALLENSRLSYRQIAKKIGVSVATVMNRVNRLEKEGLLKGYTALLDYDKLNFEVYVMISVRISKGKLFEVERKIATQPSVIAVYDHTGEFDATILARFRNTKTMDQFLKQIQTYDFVERTETKLILNTLKEGGMRV